MNTSATLTFRMPEGCKLRSVATAVVQDWLPPFRAQPVFKAARWVVQSVIEDTDKLEAPLWEPGISTEEYESRLDRPGLCWVIRATAGRGKGNILARFAVSEERPQLLEVTCPQATFPETLFDAEKLNAYLQEHGAKGLDEFFPTLLVEHGFERVE